MYSWYFHASECLVYLADVRPLSSGLEAVLDDFRHSEWFTRGWTLQELLAPCRVIFLTQAWEVFGHKCFSCDDAAPCIGAGRRLNGVVADVTRIPERVLFDIGEISKMSVEEIAIWAKNRETSRPEDIAYCMLGLFNVNMTLLYGEGGRALERLQHKIRKIGSRDEDGSLKDPSAIQIAAASQNLGDCETQEYIHGRKTEADPIQDFMKTYRSAD